MHHNKFPAPAAFSGAGAGDHLKRSASELALEALLRDHGTSTAVGAATGDSSGSGGYFGNFNHQAAGFVGNPPPSVDDLASFGFKSQENMNGFLTCGGLGESQSWYRNITSPQPCVSATIDSQSSICAGSPTSTLKPKTGDNQGSGSSEDEDVEIEGGSCEQSNDCVDVKRIRRMVSNRESARRSRRRKQAHLQDLEMQVEQLNGENVTLFKQLNDAPQQLRDATTNNRVLKSDVEALRAKVKLAEDMVTRGSLSCSLNQLLQTQLGSSTQLLNATLSRVANMSPTITIQGQDGHFGGAFPGMGNDNMDHHVLNGNGSSNGLVSDAVSGVSEMWPNWESQVSNVPK